MHPTPRTPLLAAVLCGAALLAGSCAPKEAGTRVPDIERGRYLVTHVGVCHDCHSPRGADGRFLAEQWLMGGPLPFAATLPMPWAPVAPRIAGLPQLTDEQALHFLTSGELPGGRRPRPPMPTYRFNREDARDVIAYLRNPAPGQ